jgi:hypothetical protein
MAIGQPSGPIDQRGGRREPTRSSSDGAERVELIVLGCGQGGVAKDETKRPGPVRPFLSNPSRRDQLQVQLRLAPRVANVSDPAATGAFQSRIKRGRYLSNRLSGDDQDAVHTGGSFLRPLNANARTGFYQNKYPRDWLSPGILLVG